MSRRLAIAAGAALALVIPGTAAADSTLTIKDGNALHYSDDPGINSEFSVFLQGSEIHFREPKDPQGTNTYPYETCRGVPGEGGRFVEIVCPRAGITSVSIEPGPGEDIVRIAVTDMATASAGGSGADDIVTGDTPDELTGEQGSDKLTSAGGDDILNGEDGNDTLDAGAGNDKLNGGSGVDVFVAGAGDDTVRAADGLAEKIDCGEGTDTVTADAQDELVGCENVTTQNITGVSEQPAADDKTAPTISVGGKSSQRARRSISFVATCSEKGLIQAVGYLDSAGINDAMKGSDKKVDVGGGGVVIKMKFLKRHLRNIKADLRKKRRPRVRITISCVDAAGNTSRPRKFWIALRK